MASQAKFPSPGCIVEFLEDNVCRIALVLEESSGKLRLLLPGRRESKLSANRLLPWLGPQYPANLSREDASRALDGHKRAREEKAATIQPLDVWELATGEIDQAPADWFAELFENDPDADTVASFGRALLGCKTHFRFQPPDFLIYDPETAEKRQEELKAREERDALIAGGATFLRALWEISAKKRPMPDNRDFKSLLPDGNIEVRLEKLLFSRMVNPDLPEADSIWQTVSKGLPEIPQLPGQLLETWGKVPPHHNFWLDRASFEPGDTWGDKFSPEISKLESIGRCEAPPANQLAECDLSFISIDGPTTRDIDDAFCFQKTENGALLTIALAAPALGWPFGSDFDKKIRHRATSLYLPEGDMHMLPEVLGTNAFSLLAGKKRPAFCIAITLDGNSNPVACKPFLAKITPSANLRYSDVQEILDGKIIPENPASAFEDQINLANEWAKKRENWRISQGAVVMRRPEQHVVLSGSGEDVCVDISLDPPMEDAQRIVAEMMVLASSVLADWAYERELPLIHRTQNITIPPEYAGVWRKPEDLAKIMRSMMPSVLEISPKPHSALAVYRYAPVTSPLRRYGDLLNEAQIINFLQTGQALWDAETLGRILENLLPNLEASTQVQKFRPRYWKLVYFRQKGDKCWWNGVITDENDNYATISLPEQGITVRGRRELFNERCGPGMHVSVRLGKIHPLYNEIQILETIPLD